MWNKRTASFQGATAVVTGGGSGIGEALARALAARGADVTIADLQASAAEAVAKSIESQGGIARAVAADVADFGQISAVIAGAFARTGRLDFVFNNAGISMIGGVHAFQPDDWRRLVDVNVNGVINGCQAAYKIMRDQKRGHIINTASVAGLTPHPGSTFYAATKHAVAGLSKSLSVEAARNGVRVSVLCPGVIDTPLIRGGGKFGKSLVDLPPEKLRGVWENLRPMAPEAFARQVLDDVLKGRPIIVRPSKWRAFWWIDRLSPALSMRIARSVYEKNLRKLGLP